MYQVLIVDDEPIVKIALRSMLDWGELGFHICATASNGKEALEKAEQFHPDLIICDLKMPVLDGIGLIKTAKDMGMDWEFLVISNYEDFNSVRTALVLGAFDYILKVNISSEELTAQLKKIRLKLDQKSAKGLEAQASGSKALAQQIHAVWRDFFIHKTYSLTDLAEFTGICLEDIKLLSICQISFDWYVQNLEPLPSVALIRSTLKNALEQLSRHQIIFFGPSNILLIVPDSELSLHHNTIAGLSSRISQLFQYYMSLTPDILYQSQIPDLEEARKVYSRFQELLELNFYGPLGTIDASAIPKNTPPGIPYKELSSTIQNYTGKDKASFALEKITEFLDDCRKDYIPPFQAIQYCIRFLDNLEYHLPGSTLPAHDQLSDLADAMRKAISLEELIRYITDALPIIFSPEAYRISQTGYSPEIAQALAYIQANYSRKISLTSVSDHVGLSSSYLCRIFKEETGLSMNAYITNLRMSKAGELLNDTNSYIKEVAISVGFEDQLYFSRLFKRYYGVTPSEYRKPGNSVSP